MRQDSPVAALSRISEASALAQRLPPLHVAARRVAASVMTGEHGRRQAGTGEDFWQYRSYVPGDSTQRIDWHRSGRGDQVFIRDREWSAANTLWLWPDLRPGMVYRSALSGQTKRDRAELLALALGELALRGRERVGAPASPLAPGLARSGLARIALWWQEKEAVMDFSRALQIPRHTSVVFLSDFLDPPETLAPIFKSLGERGISGHLVQVCDPAEETLPWNGRVEFEAMQGPVRYRAGKTESLREAYREKFSLQREAVRAIARSCGWTFMVHRTDASPASALLALHQRVSGPRTAGRAGVV